MLEIDDWSPPEEFDEYRLVRPLGRGTMGQVFLARDRILDRLVAIKFITALDPSARERFLIEARAAARIQHPNVLAVHRVGELHQRPFLITEYIRGQTLAELPLPAPWGRALELGVGLARGLAAAHRQGVLHRDIKLANAMLSDAGEIKLLDFSLAKLVDVVAPTTLPTRSTTPSASAGVGGVVRGIGVVAGVEVIGDTAPAFPPMAASAPTPGGSNLAETITLEAPGKAREAHVRADSRPAWRGVEADLTAAGALVGTPHYMAPELWRGEVASPASDVYALGVLLYCLCCGHPPTRATTILELATRVQTEEPRPLRERVPDVDPRLAAIVERCIRREPIGRYASGEELREALEALAADVRVRKIQGGNPYRGLEVFDAAHREVFFGRSAEIAAVVARVRAQSLIVVAGDSGVGKSSLCRAGVLPTLEEDEEATWTVASMTPGRRPLQAFCAAIARARGLDEAGLLQAAAAPEAFMRALSAATASGDTVLFIDQMEELVTLAPASDAAAVSELLGRIAGGAPGLRILATVRGDFLTRVASLPGLRDHLLRGLTFLYPLSSAAVRQAILGPALARGVRFESEALVGKLVEAGVDGSLPLLQFALAELWEARAAESGTITAAALDKIGGVSGALARHAEGVLARLTPAQRRAARALLLRLVTIDETRASLTRAELTLGSDDAAVAVDALVDARLIVIREAAEGPSVHEIAHEALIRGWVSLQVWLSEEKETRQIRHRLERAAAEWERLGKPREGLWGEVQIGEGRRLDERSLRGRELEFLAASAVHLARRRRLRLVVLIGAPMLVAVSVVTSLLIQRAAIERAIAGHLDEAGRLVADARRDGEEVERRREEAFAAFDRGDDEEGEVAWRAALRGAAAVQRLYTRAAGRLETALGLDPTRADAQSSLGDVLIEQARLAERDHNPELADALLLRVELHDPGGERMARWRAPARIAIQSPSSPEVSVARYESGADGRRRLGEAKALGRAPIAALELRPGSYLWTFRAEGRATVRLPMLLRRGEDLELTIDLPPADAAPPGFIYVPAGRFLTGSADDEELRRSFFTAAPMHEITTNDYWIARTETTYGEWIDFLDDLPPEAQALRSGRQGGAIFQAAPILVRAADGEWVLERRRGESVEVARRGAPLRTPARDRNVEQAWERLPVTGITWADARAYLDWLAATGRVPGARFCTEVEWERAARGADGRAFPTGADIGAEEANIDATYGRDPEAIGPDEVGSYPRSESPFGLLDVAGNVWEWTAPIDPGAGAVARGGSFFHGLIAARVVNRSRLDPGFHDGTLGLRVCASPHVGIAPATLRPVSSPR